MPRRCPPLELNYVLSRLRVDTAMGTCFWLDPTKHHRNLIGKEAGSIRKRCRPRNDNPYWVLSLSGVFYKRAYIVFLVANGYWPSLIDHIDGNSLNDRASNLREATLTQNNWNHRGRKKSEPTPMGVRITKQGRFQARIACNKTIFYLGTFDTVDAAHSVYSAKRKELFGAFSGRS